MLSFRRVSRLRARHLILAAMTGAAGIAIASGTVSLLRFDNTAGSASAAPRHWPRATGIARSEARPTLLVFAHPLCSCTDATMEELERAVASQRAGAAIPSIRVLFVRPRGYSRWNASRLSAKAEQLAGAPVIWDEDGLEAARFGVHTSGSVLLYSRDGDLLFEGGVTGSRGHVGDNKGLDDLVSSLNSNEPAHRTIGMVFGCSLARSEVPAR